MDKFKLGLILASLGLLGWFFMFLTFVSGSRFILDYTPLFYMVCLLSGLSVGRGLGLMHLYK